MYLKRGQKYHFIDLVHLIEKHYDIQPYTKLKQAKYRFGSALTIDCMIKFISYLYPKKYKSIQITTKYPEKIKKYESILVF